MPQPQDRAAAGGAAGPIRLPLLACALLCMLCGCKREVRDLRTDPPVAAALDQIAVLPSGGGGRPPEVFFPLGKPFRTNAYQLSEGKRLFAAFGCPACHADGAGSDRGPSLMDGWWQYGPAIELIYVSIRDGRPRGMPAFRAQLTNEQLWQLAGYVQALGSYRAAAAAPGRSDGKQHHPAENRAPARFAPLEP